MDMITLERVAEYAAEDADVTLRLKQVLWPKVEEIWPGCKFGDRGADDRCAGRDRDGRRADRLEALAEYAVELNKTLNDLEGDIRRLADEPIASTSIRRGSWARCSSGKLRIAEKPKMTKTKQFSTEEDYLQTFAHKYEIVDMILGIPGREEALSTYVEALPLLVNPVTGASTRRSTRP